MFALVINTVVVFFFFFYNMNATFPQSSEGAVWLKYIQMRLPDTLLVL